MNVRQPRRSVAWRLAIALCCLAPLSRAAAPDGRFVQKLALPAQQTAVVAEGDFEARSIGSYSVRVYSSRGAQPGDDTTFYVAGLVRARDGSVQDVFLADLDPKGPPCLVVAIRSAGTGGHRSADAFAVGPRDIVLRASVTDLPADADLVASLKGRRPACKRD